MKFWIVVLVASCFAFGCKNDSTGSQKDGKKAASYPFVYEDFSVPKYPAGTLSSDVFKEDGRRQEWTVLISTESSFEEIFNYYKEQHESQGWKRVKQNRSDQGEDTESILLVYTKEGTKHSLFVMKETIKLNQIRSTVVRYTS